MDFSIIVPTLNRPDFLLRLIRYYDALHFEGRILIGDSSTVEIFQDTAQKIKKIKGRLNILHSHLPGRSVAAAVAEMNEHLETAYVCLTGDDDFIVPDSAAKCIEFLNQNLDYVAAHGKGVLITTETGTKTTLLGVSDYPQTIIHHDRASDRAAYHLEHYSVSLFSVHKAAVWRKMFLDTPAAHKSPLCSDKAFADELLPCTLSAVSGKIGQISGLYLVRETHAARYLLPSWFTWINSEKWQPSFVCFRNKLAQTISEIDGIPLTTCDAFVETSFSKYLKQRIGQPEPQTGWLRTQASRVPFLRNTWRLFRKLCDLILPGRGTTLVGVLSPGSKYFRDFQPIYEAVTNRKSR